MRRILVLGAMAVPCLLLGPRDPDPVAAQPPQADEPHVGDLAVRPAKPRAPQLTRRVYSVFGTVAAVGMDSITIQVGYDPQPVIDKATGTQRWLIHDDGFLGFVGRRVLDTLPPPRQLPASVALMEGREHSTRLSDVRVGDSVSMLAFRWSDGREEAGPVTIVDRPRGKVPSPPAAAARAGDSPRDLALLPTLQPRAESPDYFTGTVTAVGKDSITVRREYYPPRSP